MIYLRRGVEQSEVKPTRKPVPTALAPIGPNYSSRDCVALRLVITITSLVPIFSGTLKR